MFRRYDNVSDAIQDCVAVTVGIAYIFMYTNETSLPDAGKSIAQSEKSFIIGWQIYGSVHHDKGEDRKALFSALIYSLAKETNLNIYIYILIFIFVYFVVSESDFSPVQQYIIAPCVRSKAGHLGFAVLQGSF